MLRLRLVWSGLLLPVLLVLILQSCGGGGGSGSSPGTPSGGGTTPPPVAGTDVVTYHYDTARSAMIASETILTTANVNATTFGKLGEFPVDGMIDAQPLYVSQLPIAGSGSHNVLYVATQNDTVYALDADSISGTTASLLWSRSMLASGEAPVQAADLPCGDNVSNGIMSTPVIDRARNALYLVAFSKDAGGGLHYRLHALNLANGSELAGGPVSISASAPGSGGNVSGGMVNFDPAVHQQRAALLEAGGKIHLAWGARSGDCGNYSSWVMSYDAATLAQVGVINLVPNDQGAGIWMSGAGPATDASGDIYLATGNGYAVNGDGTPATGSYTNSLVRLSAASGLHLVDSFTPFNDVTLNANDLDLGGGGVLLLPDLNDASAVRRHLALVVGKDRNIYVVDRDHLGGYGAATGSNAIYQEIDGQLGGVEFLSAPAYFNGNVYLAAANDTLRAFPINAARLAGSAASQSAHSFANGVPVVSANGTSNGIVWVDEGGPGVLYAYDANNLGTLLYSSDQAAGSRDQFGRSDRPKTPLVINGRVYLGTSYGIAAFGLLH